MTTVGNCFALLLLAITMIMFFNIKYHLTKASRYYTVSLATTLAALIVNTFRVIASHYAILPSWGMAICGTVDFLLMIFTTSALTLYLVEKISEHNTENDLFYAKLTLTTMFILLTLTLIVNIPTGFIFKSAGGVYTKGVAHFVPYIYVFAHALTVVAYCIRFRKSLARSVQLAFIESLTILALCITIKHIYEGISIFYISIVLIELIFFLNFQNHRAGVNALTKLNGSRSFFTELNTRIKKQKKFKVYLIKMQHLSLLRRNYGHKAGDEILYQFAFKLERLFYEADAFNLHGATFALVLPYTLSEKSRCETEELINFLEAPIIYGDTPTNIDYVLSEYVWNGETDTDAIHDQLENAAEAANDRGLKYAVCTAELYEAKKRRQYLISRMNEPSRESGFEVWFQPVYNVWQQSFTSMEALLRLKEEDGSYISPAEFIPLAEKTGQIVPITWFVIEEVCRALSTSALRGKHVSINLPMVQLADPSFNRVLDEIVDKYNVSHRRISFEFTERVILEELDLVEKNMKRLGRSGYSFHLDDFGTGYSNFNCVLRLPIKTVKLDMTLTSTLVSDEGKGGLVKILTDLFHDMHLKVIVEGVETAEEAEVLHSYGVDGIQGYYYAKPMPFDALKAFLKSNSPPPPRKNLHSIENASQSL